MGVQISESSQVVWVPLGCGELVLSLPLLSSSQCGLIGPLGFSSVSFDHTFVIFAHCQSSVGRRLRIWVEMLDLPSIHFQKDVFRV